MLWLISPSCKSAKSIYTLSLPPICDKSIYIFLILAAVASAPVTLALIKVFSSESTSAKEDSAAILISNALYSISYSSLSVSTPLIVSIKLYLYTPLSISGNV